LIVRSATWWPDAYRGALSALINDPDPLIRTNAAKSIGDAGLRIVREEETLIHLAQDSDSRVRRAAAISMGKIRLPGTVSTLVDLARMTGETDPALRHSAIYGLEHCATHEQLVALSVDKSADVRIAAVVALRRQKNDGVARFLDDSDPRVVAEAARAIYDVPIEAAYPQLANLIGQESLKGTALVRRVINANFRLGGVPRAIALARFAARGDEDELLRWEAIDLLSKWAEPPGRDGLTGEWWPIAKREADFLPGLVREMRERGIETAPTRVLVAWIKLAEQCGAKDQALDLIAWGSDAKRDLKVRVAALRAAQTLSPKDLEPALSSLVLDAESKVRATALSAIQLLTPAKAMPLLEQAALQGSRDERRVAYAALAKIDDPRADDMFARELAKLRAGFVPSEVALDLVEGAEQRKSDKVKQALEALLTPRKVDDKLAPFADCLYGGDRERGKKIFRERAETTCLRCHKVEWGEGGQVGPDLNGVGKRLSRLEIMESIADPNRRIARGYDAIVLTLDNDQHVAGIVVEETPDKVKVRTAQDELVEVDAKAIASRRPDLSAMPQDVSKFLSRDDMRDVIEFLANL
jgi:quinoprotein glucose dehydrogenase